jgi:methylmalonyl-CoA mutase cobalamin-binding subunit
VAVDPGWSMLLWTVGLFVVVEPITGQVIEPLLYGHSTGLSAVAVVVAATFWTWLWGPVGLLLSTPLTVCLVVLGRHVEQLQFLDVMLGDRPALSPEENFYQRMLADDPDEAADQAEEFLEKKPLSAYYDEVAVPGLALAQMDINRGALDHDRRVRIKDAVAELVDDLSDSEDVAPKTAEEGEEAMVPATATLPPVLTPDDLAPEWRETAVLCVAGRGPLDEAVATMLAQLLEKHGIGARVLPCEEASASALFRLDAKGVQLACLSYLEAGGLTNARYLVRRLRRKLPRVKVVAGFWTLTAEEVAGRGALRATGADLVVTSLRQAVEATVAAAREETSAPQQAVRQLGDEATTVEGGRRPVPTAG